MASRESQRAVERALGFLEQHQLPSGEFPAYRGSDLSPTGDASYDPSVYPTSLVVNALERCVDPSARRMTARALTWLRQQMDASGCCRFWADHHPVHAASPVDVDDTASVSYVLQRSGIAFPDNRRVLSRNRDRRGHFYTWIVPRWPVLDLRLRRVPLGGVRRSCRRSAFWSGEASADDVDPVINAVVLLYLGDCRATRAVGPMLRQVVERGGEATCDHWYRRACLFHYMLARCAAEDIDSIRAIRPLALRRILLAVNAGGGFGDDPLETALFTCALQLWDHTGDVVDRALDHLVSTQALDGSWPASPIYYDGPREVVRWGSREVTTAVCVQALEHRTLDCV